MLLVFVLLLPSFSFVTFAGSPITEEPVEIFNPDEESDTSSEPESIEILNRRARNVKHFRHEDGTIEAIIYGYAVHRQDEDGNWQDIDNRLILLMAIQHIIQPMITAFALPIRESVN